jgi:ATP diphosphatase
LTEDVTRLDPARLDTLRAIMRALRTPITGCPWDLQQTFASIAPYTIEEAYEVADAIERDNHGDLRDELGDLLLQVVYHSQIAAELGLFSFEDVVSAVSQKMIRRHPHVFGDAEAKNAKLAKDFWEDIKAKEKTSAPQAGALAGIPANLPALTRALKLQSKAAKVGFDWPSLDQVLDKISEEISELRAASQAEREPEMGDLLFAVVNAARHLDVDSEKALRSANAKFARRFAHIEQRLAENGKSPQQSSLEEMDALWDEAKALGL